MDKLVDLRYTAADKKERKAEMKAWNGPDEPYGLCVRLEKPELEKLGMANDLPEVGEEVKFTAIGQITSVHRSAGENDMDSKSVEIRIQFMNFGNEGKETEKSTTKEENSEASMGARGSIASKYGGKRNG